MTDTQQKCSFPNCNNIGKMREQLTSYQDDSKNWACYCEECQKYVDDYWDEMWAEYNRGTL